MLHSAATQLTHPHETTIEDDASLLASWHRRATTGKSTKEGEIPTGRMIAAVQFRMQRKQAVSKTKRVAAGELDALSTASGGWNP